MGRLALKWICPLATAALSACGYTPGFIPVGPDTYFLSEMRAEAIGGGPRAQATVLAEAAGFCRQQGRVVALLNLRPGGDPRGYYWPTAFDATFRCAEQTAKGSGIPLQ